MASNYDFWADVIGDQKYFVYCCTNALLLDRMVQKIPPSKHFCWVVHMDGMEQKHDESVAALSRRDR